MTLSNTDTCASLVREQFGIKVNVTPPDWNQEVRTFTYYCLGSGMLMCNTCQYDANWKRLNDDNIISDTERKALQKDMTRIDESYCQLTSGKMFLAKDLPKQNGCGNDCAGCKCKED